MRRHKLLGGLLLTGLILGLACGEDDGSGPPPGDPPVVTGISPTTVSPGDTVTISGSNFSSVETENTVTFRNPISAIQPFEASETELRVVVDKDATDGQVTVATEGGSDTTTESLDVLRGIGDVFVFGGTGTNQTLVLANPSASTRYLVVPHASNANASVLTNHGYEISSATAPPVALTAEEAPRPLHISAHEWFETQRWENAAKVVERYGTPRGAFAKRPVLEAPAGGGFRQFYVLKTTTGDQNSASSYARITAQLRYSGTKCLVYADVETLMTGNFAQSHFTAYGQTFDNSIEATNVSYFGAYSDVDGNDKVVLLVSPVVNRLQEPPCELPDGPCDCGFIAGFFNPRDLYASPPVPSGTTNHAEVLYLLAADPNGTWDCSFPVAETASENLGTITHEHEHLISFSHRIFFQGGVAQATWLEEGMAHMAEDLNGENSSNFGRGREYRRDPGGISLEDNSAPLEQRGGIYLMLRLLADRYGTGILKNIVQSKCTGRACIQNVTGMTFNDVFGEFLAAQYLSGRGITSDERYNYSSIDINDFGALTVIQHVAGGADVTGTVRRSGGDFHIFTGLIGLDSVFEFNATSGQPNLRSVIVQIQ